MSASDLAHFLACRHRTAVDLSVIYGGRPAPSWVDPAMALLQERGLIHERQYVNALQSQGLRIIDLADHVGQDAAERTLEAMRGGADIIVQALLQDTQWSGRPDVLRRVLTPSTFGRWSYEVLDTKLAKETRGEPSFNSYSTVISCARSKGHCPNPSMS